MLTSYEHGPVLNVDTMYINTYTLNILIIILQRMHLHQ